MGGVRARINRALRSRAAHRPGHTGAAGVGVLDATYLHSGYIMSSHLNVTCNWGCHMCRNIELAVLGIFPGADHVEARWKHVACADVSYRDQVCA